MAREDHFQPDKDKKVRKAAKIKNRYNQVPHLTEDTKWDANIACKLSYMKKTHYIVAYTFEKNMGLYLS